MKKLMVAVVSAASAMLAFGALPHGADFEAQAYTEGASFNTYLDKGDDGASTAGDRYWSSTGDEIGVISNGSHNATSVPDIYDGAPSAKYLQLDSNTNRLYRSVASDGAAVAMDTGDGIYLDTLVKFTPADDVFDASAFEGGDKIAIEYVEREGDGTKTAITNFVVRAGVIDGDTANYLATVPDFDAAAWHRLTVRTIADFGGRPGFKIYVDEVALTYLTDNAEFAQSSGYTDDTHTIFPSAVLTGQPNADSISAVAFAGNGSIDDVVFTSTKPDFIQEATIVTVTWTTAEVTALTLNDKVLTAEELAVGSYDIEPVEGAVTFTATLANGYELGTCTVTEDKGGWNGSDAFTNLVAGATCTIDAIIPLYQVGGKNYEDLEAAMTAASAGTQANPATLKLLAACNQGLAFTEGYVILDLNGCDIQGGAQDDYTIGNAGATLFITNSGVEASIKVPTNPLAGGVVMTAAGFTTFQAGTFEGSVVTAAVESETAVPKDYQLITGGKFFDDSDNFYLADCVADGLTYSKSGDYVIVGATEPAEPTCWADVLGDAAQDGAYEIGDLEELKNFQKYVGAESDGKFATAGLTFRLTADIALDAAWPGIGLQNGKDVYSDAAKFDPYAFQGTFDGQNHTISGFQMVGGGLDYCGFFNSIYNATIKDLKIQYAGALFATDTTALTAESGATFVGVAKNSTLVNLTSLQKDDSTPVAISKGFGGIVGYLAGSTVDTCTNNVSASSSFVKNNVAGNKVGGIAMICQQAGCSIVNCVNNGTPSTGSNEFGGILAYTDTITISNCQNTAACKMFYHHGGTVTLQGTNTGNATVQSYTGNATPGLNFATVDGDVATFVADNALALNGSYKVMATGATATFEFTAAGTIAFDTALFTPTFAITAASGLAFTDATSGTVKTYTAAVSIEPGQSSQSYATEADAQAAAAAVEVGVPTAVATELSTEAQATYKAMFEPTVVSDGAGGYKVEVAMTTAAAEATQAQADADAAEVIEDLTVANVTLTTTPGLYYSFEYGTTLENMTEGARTLATGSTLELARPTTENATSGFYKVLVNITDK